MMTSLNCQEQVRVISVISSVYHAYAINVFHGCKINTFQMRDCDMSRVLRKPAFCICENKDADQLRGNREADQRLCFRYIDSSIPLLPKSGISSL